jgi:hypothetical protein
MLEGSGGGWGGEGGGEQITAHGPEVALKLFYFGPLLKIWFSSRG